MTQSSLVWRAIASIGWLLLAYLLIYHAREITKIHTWAGSGFRDTRLAEISTQPAVIIFQSVVGSDFEGPPYPAAGDTVVRINRREAEKWDVSPFWAGDRLPAGQPLSVTFVHGGDTLRTAFAMHAPSRPLVWGFVTCEALRILITLSSLGVGMWALRGRHGTRVVPLFAVYSFSIAAMVSITYFFLPGSYAAFTIPLAGPIEAALSIFGFLFGGFWLHLQYIYPRPLEWVRRHPFWAYSLCYLPSLLNVLLWINSVLSVPLVPALAEGITAWLAITIIEPVPILVSLAILIYRYRRSTDRLEIRQLRLILWAVTGGILIQCITPLVNTLFPVWYYARLYRDLSLSTIAFTALLLGPLAFAYAFRKYRLMEVEGGLRRATRIALVGGVLILLLVGVVYGLSRVMLVALDVRSPAPSMVVAFVLALGVLPAQRRLRGYVERRMYPERQKLRDMLHSFLQQASTLPDQCLFWRELERHLKEGLKVAGVYPVMKGDMPAVFADDSRLLPYLAQARRPLLVDEALGSGLVDIQEAEAAWLSAHEVGLILPLVLHQTLLGFLAIGLRTDRQDYDAEELQILNSLAPQIAIASENLKLLEENVAKRELEQQLQMARQIQQGFLPQQIPRTPGLEVAAISRFCLEVAGDYYDVLPLRHDRTVLAIGDVSGKGAGAALIMANLQASLRTALRMNVGLAEAVGEINSLICQNTPPDQYITFFAALFDPSESTLTYVNAGHNPPILTHTDGSSEFLEIGGTVLGIVPEFVYQEGTVRLTKDDLLLLYTDGVSEATDDDGEQFGDRRILRFLEHETGHRPEEVLKHLEAEVIAHHGSLTFEDDFTLLLAKVL